MAPLEPSNDIAFDFMANTIEDNVDDILLPINTPPSNSVNLDMSLGKRMGSEISSDDEDSIASYNSYSSKHLKMN